MEFPINQLLVLLLAIICLVVIMVMFTQDIDKSKAPIINEADRRNLCNKWILGGCTILDKAYEEALVKAQICEPCPMPANAGTDLTAIESDMIKRCGDDDGEWMLCRKLCSCPEVNIRYRGCGATKCTAEGKDCLANQQCLCQGPACACVDSKQCGFTITGSSTTSSTNPSITTTTAVATTTT